MFYLARIRFAGPDPDGSLQTVYDYNETYHTDEVICVRYKTPNTSPTSQDTMGDCHPQVKDGDLTWSLENNGTGYILNIIALRKDDGMGFVTQYFDSGSVFLPHTQLTGAGEGRALDTAPDFFVPYSETQTQSVAPNV